ncbi:hypothetical protein SLS62_001802 [Diatrype stigma]|uniref:Amidohydrolase-related domain-containing protein n=1 Tax=Diatrype stigma TaxID=117547 RepID=A0AAN9V7X4_9PEZI
MWGGRFIARVAKAIAMPSSPHANPSQDERAANDYVSRNSDARMPPGSWDSHIHVMDPGRYPPDPKIPYTPGTYTVWDNAIFENSIGCDHVLLVQTATHGHDNTLMLDSLRACGTSRALGIALFDPKETAKAQLDEWNKLGVRGVRVNLVTYNDEVSIADLRAQLNDYADLIRPLEWVLQLFVRMEMISALEEFLPSLGVKVVFDHYGDPEIPEPSCPHTEVDLYSIAGFGALVRLLKGGNTWVKISGAYRLTRLSLATCDDVDSMTLELFREAPTQLVFGSDWPHVRFDGFDITPWVHHLLDLTDGNQEMRERLFRDNARVLWGVENV